MHPNAAMITQFYEAFARLDADAMAACYGADIRFSDPAFGELKGAEVAGMWKMLAARAKEFSLTFRDVHADDTSGRAHWEATYLFSKTGRRVHNVIEATFEISQGKITRHDDHFDLWRWAGMAFGVSGTLLGWTPLVQGKIRSQARAGLDEFMKTR